MASRKLLTFGRGEILYAMHHQEAGRDFSLSFKPVLEDYCAVGDRRVADVLMEQTAKRAKTLKANFVTDIGNRQSTR